MLKKEPNPFQAKPGDDEPPMPLISVEDVGPLAGAAICLFMLIAITYYIFFQPSPFQKIYDQFDKNAKKIEKVEKTAKPKAPVMMPAQAIGISGPNATKTDKSAPAQKSAQNPTGNR